MGMNYSGFFSGSARGATTASGLGVGATIGLGLVEAAGGATTGLGLGVGGTIGSC